MRQIYSRNKSVYLRARALAAAFALSLSFLTATAQAAPEQKEKLLVPMGCAVGIQINMDGVLVVGLVESAEGQEPSPAAGCGLMPGDLITSMDGCEVHCGEDFRNAVAKLTGGPVEVTAVRNGETLEFTLEPRVSENGVELGLWLRDGVTGIGTLTYYDPESGSFGGLGHSINDLDSGVLIPMGRGHIMRSSISGIIKGSSGSPGELCGSFDESGVCGSVSSNTPCGIFGQLIDGVPSIDKAIPAASEDEVKLGPATVLTNTSGMESEEFDIEIVRIYRGDEANRSMMIKITDPRLIERTGGIVQGMSGSPIIQDGKLIGAVTHVMINDPTQGFGIFIENMLKTAQEQQTGEK